SWGLPPVRVGRCQADKTQSNGLCFFLWREDTEKGTIFTFFSALSFRPLTPSRSFFILVVLNEMIGEQTYNTIYLARV
ncbi:hypothetical protein, partial [Halalkalibacter alkalisediminis]|uniref:hypothetical protein n=1 Tax=Halalkalibacter alkalisediminis TaxID=935616 RepID=UPI00235F9733